LTFYYYHSSRKHNSERDSMSTSYLQQSVFIQLIVCWKFIFSIKLW